jgi:hypothetical protein
VKISNITAASASVRLLGRQDTQAASFARGGLMLTRSQGSSRRAAARGEDQLWMSGTRRDDCVKVGIALAARSALERLVRRRVLVSLFDLGVDYV